ncbi:hypothetical protein [Myxococcus landrumensis]|uniref:DUF2780 domain-containing protein n=1 Tax=Myxococcus landrumensis TaxID=2813577 RepID=A0ABX7N8M5_9BACT|nr:hypothetical protein [Myxococcus landrumus]QSQ14811.1 hypothetical protein JY572_01595 [Myxococcus landrumus]
MGLLSKILNVGKQVLSAVNPIAGAALGFVEKLAKGENPLKAALSSVTDLIPGGGALKNILGKFAGKGMMDGAGGNSLLDAGMKMATGQGKVTDLLGDLFKANKQGFSAQGMGNVAELAAQQMSKLIN